MATRYRTLFLSDLHLGMRGCRAERVLDFLRHHEADHYVLVGDLVDGWALARKWHWPQAHNDVVQKLLRVVRKGATMTYVPGNHDDAARQFAGLNFGGVDVRRETVHVTADGRRLLVIHGDEFDGMIRFAPWLSRLGARAYELALALNTVVAAVRERLGYDYWSLAGALKDRTKKALQYVAHFEDAVAARAAAAGVDGVVCGHIHRPEIRAIATADGEALYVNCGDWVENCTAIAEHADGRLELIRWTGALAPGQRDLFEDAEPFDAAPALALAALAGRSGDGAGRPAEAPRLVVP